MKKLAALLSLFISCSASAQTIFYYGRDSVSSAEFLAAYQKNNTGKHSVRALTDYLELYINSKLKVKEAKANGYDTLPQLVSDLADLRQQILPSYLNDKASVDKLVAEAKERSVKDIHLAHLFISLRGDTASAQRKLEEAESQLKNGADFLDAAKRFSDDPAARNTGGDLGWITVFSLPYEFENIAYATKAGSISKVYRSKAGYHIFKNLGERPDPGKLRASQILLAFPPGTDDEGKSKIASLASSLYARLLRGEDFSKLASEYSNDVISSAAEGQMQEFGIGQYDPVFETQAFALRKDGDFTRPFLTSYGYHIVKRLSIISRAALLADPRQNDKLRDLVQQSDRINAIKSAIAEKILSSVTIRKGDFKPEELWAFSDSVINNQVPSIPIHLLPTTPLLYLQDRTYTVTDWIAYTQVFRYQQDGSGIRAYPALWNDFIQAKALEYYQDNLEKYNDAFKQQIEEFGDGNLFFEIMQRKVWGPAQTDSTALSNYFNEHRSKYQWGPSADAVVFYGQDANTTKSFRDQITKRPASWRSLAADFGEKISADSARFDIKQIPNGGKSAIAAKLITPIATNANDHTYSFAYVIRPYSKPEARSFQEARGLVISDYQNYLEKIWVDELRNKYPVKINHAALSDLIKKKLY